MVSVVRQSSKKKTLVFFKLETQEREGVNLTLCFVRKKSRVKCMRELEYLGRGGGGRGV